ncbi:MAG: type II toxin-antitoxin system VapC family toxin [Chloroflexota bacterium]|nr:type II toxin-antitoxin system VapC family toxin [Chloroflexota bacterium]
MIVVDASIIASALGDDGSDGERARNRLTGERLAAPELIDLEVASVWRRAARAGRLAGKRAHQALADLAVLPLERAPHQPLMSRIWELRENFTPYDAAYVALAEIFNAALVTADQHLARAPAADCEIELLG